MKYAKLNCRYFIGERPCKYKEDCLGCKHYSPFGTKILIIKLAAMGDLLRTTPLIAGLKRKFKDSHITWLTDEASYELLRDNGYINRLLTFNLESVLRLQVEEFDILYCLDKETRATALATLVKAKDKKGFSMHHSGNIYPLNKSSEYGFKLGICNNLKFRENKKTYQEIIFEMCEIPYKRDEYILNLSDEEIRWGREHLYKAGIADGCKIVGLNTGCGNVFMTKKWPIEHCINLANKLHKDLDVEVVLLGGPVERERNSLIKKKVNFKIIDAGNDNSIRDFASIIRYCNAIVTADTIALHLAIAQNVPVVGLFGPTCAQEIDFYGRGKAIVSSKECVPCYRNSCNIVPNCMEMVSVDSALEEIKNLIGEQ